MLSLARRLLGPPAVAALLLGSACATSVSRVAEGPGAPVATHTLAPVGSYVEYKCTESVACSRPRVVREIRTAVGRDDEVEVIERVEFYEDGSNRVEQLHYSLRAGGLRDFYEGVVDGAGSPGRPSTLPAGPPPTSFMGRPVEVSDNSSVETLVTPAGTFRAVRRNAGARVLGMGVESVTWYEVDGKTPFRLLRAEERLPGGCEMRCELVAVHWEGGISRLHTPALDRVRAGADYRPGAPGSK